MIRRTDALEYHGGERPGKISLKPTRPCLSPRDLRLAYLPGAAWPAEEIARDPREVFRFTARGNLVGVVTNGSAVPGLGDVGPFAAKPMQEGLAVLFKQLADIDVFDLELAAREAQALEEIIVALAPTFGAILLKDIAAPLGLELYDRLAERLEIPVYHASLCSTAVVATAALYNALALVDKRIEDLRVVLCGAGTMGIGCARMLRGLGLGSEQLFVYDALGPLRPERQDLHASQRAFARAGCPPDLAAALRGADVFIGASAAGVLSLEMVRSMARYPVVMALATPEPEICWELAQSSRQDILVATGLGQYPNAVLDVLAFPYILRGALDVQASRISEGMLLAAARSLAELARDEVPEDVVRAYGNRRFSFGPQYLLPTPIDPRILVRESAAVAAQAVREGLARKPVEEAQHEESLRVRLGTGRETLRGLILRARQSSLRVVFADGASETILRACAVLRDERICEPVLIGEQESVTQAIGALGLDLGGVEVVDPRHCRRREEYIEAYLGLRARRGLIRMAAAERLLQPDYLAAFMVHCGDAEMMVAGCSAHYIDTLRVILNVVGTAPGASRISSHYLVLLPREVALLADCAVNVDPSAEELAEIALFAAASARRLGLQPRVAMLSYSNFGSVDHGTTRKVRRATEIAGARDPSLMIDGEMQLSLARDGALREDLFPFSRLKGQANVLVFPDMQSGHLTLTALQQMAEAQVIGPLLMGARLPAHLLQFGMRAEEVVNLTAVGVVEAMALGKGASERP